jgi:hypothetical protein
MCAKICTVLLLLCTLIFLPTVISYKQVQISSEQGTYVENTISFRAYTKTLTIGNQHERIFYDFNLLHCNKQVQRGSTYLGKKFVE